MYLFEVLRKKANDGNLSEEEIDYFIQELVSNKVDTAQIGKSLL